MNKIIIITLGLFTGCGMTIRHQVSGTVNANVPTNYIISGTFVVPSSTFDTKCAQKFKDVASSVDRNAQIDQCITQNQAIVQQLINTLNGVPQPTPSPTPLPSPTPSPSPTPGH